MINNTKK